jgi:hypothetical protein
VYAVPLNHESKTEDYFSFFQSVSWVNTINMNTPPLTVSHLVLSVPFRTSSIRRFSSSYFTVLSSYLPSSWMGKCFYSDTGWAISKWLWARQPSKKGLVQELLHMCNLLYWSNIFRLYTAYIKHKNNTIRLIVWAPYPELWCSQGVNKQNFHVK